MYLLTVHVDFSRSPAGLGGFFGRGARGSVARCMALIRLDC